jgi:hypothetical protein
MTSNRRVTIDQSQIDRSKDHRINNKTPNMAVSLNSALFRGNSLTGAQASC